MCHITAIRCVACSRFLDQLTTHCDRYNDHLEMCEENMTHDGNIVTPNGVLSRWINMIYQPAGLAMSFTYVRQLHPIRERLEVCKACPGTLPMVQGRGRMKGMLFDLIWGEGVTINPAFPRRHPIGQEKNPERCARPKCVRARCVDAGTHCHLNGCKHHPAEPKTWTPYTFWPRAETSLLKEFGAFLVEHDFREAEGHIEYITDVMGPIDPLAPASSEVINNAGPMPADAKDLVDILFWEELSDLDARQSQAQQCQLRLEQQQQIFF